VNWLIEVIEKALGSAPVSAPPKPEPTRQAKKKEVFEPELILIPAGEFLMGSDLKRDKVAYQDEQPQHKLFLPDYYIAKTPVTNAQYAAFVQVTGYQTEAEQASSGWVWEDSHWKEVKGANWQHPTGPGSDISQKSHHPVVQVSWHDTLAYCEWLAQVTGKAYRLPSEAEWEKAARGTDGRIYPWGNEWEAKRCNTSEGGKKDTTPVGSYLTGASPYGLLDMAGNVWEWTRSLWGADVNTPDFNYPYAANDGREELKTGDEIRRVLRGGSFLSNQNPARCACRDGSRPHRWDYDRGCRVVVSPIL
jgi:formylglycine-generating enzyme required for sulfatase activity